MLNWRGIFHHRLGWFTGRAASFVPNRPVGESKEKTTVIGKSKES